MIEIAICVIASFFIGYFGRNRKMGFWGYLFASILLTPVIGLLLVIVSDKKKEPSECVENLKEGNN